MREMSKWNSLSDADNGVVACGVRVRGRLLPAGPGHFGRELAPPERMRAPAARAAPLHACTPVQNGAALAGRFAIARRGDCTFAQKVRNLKEAGATLAIIIDNVEGSTHENTALFAMSGDGQDDIDIPAVFLFSREAQFLEEAMAQEPQIELVVGELASMRREDEGGCAGGAGAGGAGGECAAPRDQESESFEHLKRVLSQLVAQFELSLSSEEAQAKHSFTDEIAVADAYLQQHKKTDVAPNVSITSKQKDSNSKTHNEQVAKDEKRKNKSGDF